MLKINFSGKEDKINIFPISADNYSLVLAELSKEYKKILFVANSDDNLEIIAKQISFFNADATIITIPSWDCSPYNKTSPNINNVTQRIQALNHLDCKSQEKIVLISVETLIQLLPPKQAIAGVKITVGEKCNYEEIINLLVSLSFRRYEVASEPGDFAVRGDIIDVVTKPDEGWRINFFGSCVETIKIFDPSTQISSKSINSVEIFPSSEIILSDSTIEEFKKNFIKYFGVSSTTHPIYQAIEQGHKYAGFEHYLPLFYPKLLSIFDYFDPELAVFEDGYAHQLSKFRKEIEENYDDRKNSITQKFQDEVVYFPISPELLWLDLDDVEKKLENIKKIRCYSFNLDNENGQELNIKKIDDFDLIARTKKISAFDILKDYHAKSRSKIIICCISENSMERIRSILESYNFHIFKINNASEIKDLSVKAIGLTKMPINHGYSFDNITFISEQDLLGEKIIRKKSKKNIDNLLDELNNIQIGEYVVHQKHGIGLFSGLEVINVGNCKHDCLKIIYDGGDVLYLPVENLDLLTRYGSGEESIRLDKLGGVGWKTRKAKLKEKLKEIAEKLIKTAALRASKKGEVFIPNQNFYSEFCARFRYVETDDQLNSIRDVEEDLAAGKPMDRLICGDVGFGKTEVAMRAAFSLVLPENSAKQQVAVIVPTTLLAKQHYQAFYKRFAGFDVVVRQLSRLVSAREAKETRAGLKDGSVDIVIGTHALLSKNIEFSNLGMIIIDEEHRFGVDQKEKLKQVKENIHILSLSATPIPRTLQMSLTGVRDLSIIATPPVDRHAVKTFIMSYDSVVIREAILREYQRGGQIYYVCPRISDITEILPKLKELVPEVKIVIAHGQMSAKDLEEVTNNFYNKKYDLLLCTPIIESGIDIAEANTIFIHRSDMFGLAALYQLRGRVGRSNIKAFAYLLLPNNKLSKYAMSRLEIMQTLDNLGAGFTVASHDMDIRGFGNLVGDEQSGHIKDVGLELYQQMLHEAIQNLQNTNKEEKLNELDEEFSPQINLNLPVMIPEEYIDELSLRLSIYRHIASLKNNEEIDSYAIELEDRFGKIPTELRWLLETIKLKILAKAMNIEKIDVGEKAMTITYRENKCLNPEKLLSLIEKNQSYLKIRPDQKLLISKSFSDGTDRIKFIANILELLA